SGRNITLPTTLSCPSNGGSRFLPVATSQREIVQEFERASTLLSGRNATRALALASPLGIRWITFPVSASWRETEQAEAAARSFPQGEKRNPENSPGMSSSRSPVGMAQTRSRFSPSTAAEARRLPSGEKARTVTSPL